MDAEIGTLLAELDPAIYVIDCLPNMDAKTVAEPPGRWWRRSARPGRQTPILRWRSNLRGCIPDRGQAPQERGGRAALRKAYEELVAAGDRHLAYLPGEKLLAADGEERWTLAPRRTWASCIRRTRFRRRWNRCSTADGAGAAGNDPVGPAMKILQGELRLGGHNPEKRKGKLVLTSREERWRVGRWVRCW